MKFDTDEFYLRSPDEMYDAMPDHEEALATSAAIAELVEPNYESLGLGRAVSPRFSRPTKRHPRNIYESFASRACATATAKTRRRRLSTGWSTSCRSSTGWGSPLTS